SSSDAGDLILATGLTQQQGIPELHSGTNEDPAWLAMWGEQAVEGGNKATSPILHGTDLGLAVIMAPGTGASSNKDSKDYLFTFPLKNGSASWYSLAAWDQEGTNDPIAVDDAREARYYVARVADIDHVTSREQFLAYVKQVASRLTTPVTVKVLSSA